MGKTAADIYNLISVREHKKYDSIPIPKPKRKSLIYECFGGDNFMKNNELFDSVVRKIAYKLAVAIDNNSVKSVKEIKSEYGDLNEYEDAKKIIEKYSKQLWNVFEKDNSCPKEALKSLGISIKPDLDFILGNSVKYFEKDNGKMTANIIESTLNNKNLDYSIDDIHKYLTKMNKTHNCEYNFNTVAYLITKHNYNKTMLKELGIKEDKIQKTINKLSFKIKLRFMFAA